LFVTFYLESQREAPEEVILDFDATDDPVHGEQEGRFFHGYYGHYCYLPLYVFAGDHLLAAKLRTSDRDGADGSTEVLARLVQRIRERWPETRIIVRADSGFARDALMSWCEAHGVYYVLGLAKNVRLLKKIGVELARAKELYDETGRASRVFAHFHYRTRTSWSCVRRVIAKAEHLAKGPNPRFVVTNLPEDYADARTLYETVYCRRGEMENRIKEQQLDLFADRTSTSKMRSNQLRLWFSSLAYVLVSALRRIALSGTRMAKAITTLRSAAKHELRIDPPAPAEDRRPNQTERPPLHRPPSPDISQLSSVQRPLLPPGVVLRASRPRRIVQIRLRKLARASSSGNKIASPVLTVCLSRPSMFLSLWTSLQ